MKCKKACYCLLIGVCFIIFNSSISYSSSVIDTPIDLLIKILNPANISTYSIDINRLSSDSSPVKLVARYVFNFNGAPEKIEFFGDNGFPPVTKDYTYSKDGKAGSFVSSDSSGKPIEIVKLTMDSDQRKILSEMNFDQAGKIKKIKNYSYAGNASDISEIVSINSEMNCLEKISIVREATGRVSDIKIYVENMMLVETLNFLYNGSSCEIIFKPSNDMSEKIIAGFDKNAKLIRIDRLYKNGKINYHYELKYTSFNEKKRTRPALLLDTGEIESDIIPVISASISGEDRIARIIRSRVAMARVCNNPESSLEDLSKAMQEVSAANNNGETYNKHFELVRKEKELIKRRSLKK